MAIFRSSARGIDMTVPTFDPNGVRSGSSTFIRLTYPSGDYFEWTGTFQYDAFGQFVGGTVTGIERIIGGQRAFVFTDVAVDALTFFSQPDDFTAAAFVLAGDDLVLGRNGDDVLFGFDGIDRIVGGGGADSLHGGNGNDLLFGGAQDDRLTGGAGADRLTGDDGADIFALLAIGDSTRAGAGRDRIVDFDGSEGDRIDLSAIDADQTAANTTNDAFTIVSAFSRTAGELTVTAIAGGYVVQGDVTGDGRADFAMNVITDAPLTTADFLL